MEKEKRLIDANALTVPERKETGDPFIDGFQQGKIDAIIEVRTLAPTVDAVEVPCRMGDVVWGIARLSKGRVYVKQGVVYQMFFGEDMRLCICVKNVCRGEWGKNVFATEAEALAAIGERRTDNG